MDVRRVVAVVDRGVDREGSGRADVDERGEVGHDRELSVGVGASVRVGGAVEVFRQEDAGVRGVGDCVVVVVGVTDVACTVAIIVQLVDVDRSGTVVDGVDDRVAVPVRVADVAEAVAVDVRLVGVGDGDTVVDGVHDRVTVEVVADVAVAVAVDVLLPRIGVVGTVVGAVVDGVVVDVGVAGVAQAVAIDVGLAVVGRVRAVVGNVAHAVPVAIGVADVADGVAIEVFLPRVGVVRAVVDDALVTVGHSVCVRVADDVKVKCRLVVERIRVGDERCGNDRRALEAEAAERGRSGIVQPGDIEVLVTGTGDADDQAEQSACRVGGNVAVDDRVGVSVDVSDSDAD